MSQSYPLPSYATHIWALGDKLAVCFPPLEGNEGTHTIEVPITEAGIKTLFRVLTSRAEMGNKGWLGTKASPTRHDYAAMLSAMTTTVKVTRIEPKRDVGHKSPEEILAEVGL